MNGLVRASLSLNSLESNCLKISYLAYSANNSTGYLNEPIRPQRRRILTRVQLFMTLTTHADPVEGPQPDFISPNALSFCYRCAKKSGKDCVATTWALSSLESTPYTCEKYPGFRIVRGWPALSTPKYLLGAYLLSM